MLRCCATSTNATASARSVPLATATRAAPARRGSSDMGRNIVKKIKATTSTRLDGNNERPVRRLIPRRLEFAGTTLMGIAERGTNAEVTVVRGRCCFCSKRLSKHHTEQKCWLNPANQAICYSTDDEEEAIAESSHSGSGGRKRSRSPPRSLPAVTS